MTLQNKEQSKTTVGDMRLALKAVKRPCYLQQSTKTNGDIKHINTKVSAALFNDFEAAKKAAEAYGFEVNTTALVRAALTDAIEEIRIFIEAQDNKPIA